MKRTDSLEYLKKMVSKFRDERGWKIYHNPKDLAISIIIEAAELLELFQWRTVDEIKTLLNNNEFKSKIIDEIADVMIYILSLADILAIDLGKAVEIKIRKNEKKYPADLVYGGKFRDLINKRTLT